MGPFFDISLIFYIRDFWLSLKGIIRGLFPGLVFLAREFHISSLLPKFPWSFVSLCQDRRKWKILLPRETIFVNSSANLSFAKGWQFSNFSVGTTSTEMLRKEFATCFWSLTIWFVGGLDSVCFSAIFVVNAFKIEKNSVVIYSTSSWWLFMSCWKPQQKWILFSSVKLFKHLQGFILGFGVI